MCVCGYRGHIIIMAVIIIVIVIANSSAGECRRGRRAGGLFQQLSAAMLCCLLALFDQLQLTRPQTAAATSIPPAADTASAPANCPLVPSRHFQHSLTHRRSANGLVPSHSTSRLVGGDPSLPVVPSAPLGGHRHDPWVDLNAGGAASGWVAPAHPADVGSKVCGSWDVPEPCLSHGP